MIERLLPVLVFAAALPIPADAQGAPEGIPLGETLAARLAASGVPADSTRVLGRSGIAPGLDALLVEVGREFTPRDRILFALPDDPGATPWEIGRMSGHWERVTLDAAAPMDVIVRFTDTYGIEQNRQYFIDREGRTVTGTREFSDPEPGALLVTADTLYAVYDFGAPGQYFLSGAVDAGRVAVSRVHTDDPVKALVMRNDTVLALTATRELYRQGEAWVGGRARPRPLRPAEGVRLLHSRLPQFRIVPGGILETRVADSLLVRLDFPDYDDFVRARPEHHEAVPGVEILTEIGPTVLHGGRVWFGLTFYDGEGMDGVGAVGWFDPEAREAEMIYPDELADWSVSAITGHGDGIYVGRVVHPEGADLGGGIARYDIVTGALETYDIAGVVARIAVRGETIFALTDRGLVVLEPGAPSRCYRLVPGPGGAARVIVSRGPSPGPRPEGPSARP